MAISLFSKISTYQGMRHEAAERWNFPTFTFVGAYLDSQARHLATIVRDLLEKSGGLIVPLFSGTLAQSEREMIDPFCIF
jgi:hypothetical protein